MKMDTNSIIGKETNMEKIYKSYINYGQIIKRDEFEFPDDNVFITMIAIEMEGFRRLFIKRNGVVVHMEIIGNGI
jgi:hypothetical protein